MSENKHTPGPWYAEVDDDGEFFIMTAGPRYICCGGSVHARMNENKANAPLIAAAPELLEALKFAGPQLEVLHQHYSGSDAAAIFKIIGMCRAAIAKAEGRS